MKKLAALLTSSSFFLLATSVLAKVEDITIKQPSKQGGVAAGTPIADILQNVITIIFVVAALIVVFMLIIGAFQWIVSGGDKEAVGKARGRITNALIGLVILALAFLIVRVVGQIVGINILGGAFTLPSLGDKPI